MFNKKIGLACLAGASMLSTGLAYADEDQATPKNWHITVSAKTWYESWSTWQVTGATLAGNGTLINSSDAKFAVLGGATFRYKNIFVSGNYSPATTFTFNDIGQQFKRSEGDINVGYYVHPQVGISLGYKQVKLDYQPGVWTHNFLTLGVNGSARIEGTPFFLYGNGAGSLTGSTSVDFPLTGTKGTPKYQSMEVGFGYVAMKNLIVTGGYKFQQVELPLTFGSLTEKTRDTTTGYIFGVAYTF
jgi:hypothetical protein